MGNFAPRRSVGPGSDTRPRENGATTNPRPNQFRLDQFPTMNEAGVITDWRPGAAFAGDWDLSSVSCVVSEPWAARPCMRAAIDRTWASYRERFPSSYDGTLLSLKSVECTPSGVTIRCAPTSFSAYVGTRNPRDFLKAPYSDRANPLGMTGIALARDGKVFVGRRSASAEQIAVTASDSFLYEKSFFADSVHARACTTRKHRSLPWHRGR